MTLRKTATKPRQRWALLIGAVAALTLVIAGVSLAVHDEDFELDGNIQVDAGDPPIDWASAFDSNGDELTLPAAFTSSGFDRDFSTNANGSFNTSDGSTFATGSKDTLPITPGWQCNFDNNVNSKIDIMNSYAVGYEDPVTEDEILYFALERNANTGTANVGFWFLQDDDVDCSSSGGAVAFSGDHVDGDLLVVTEYTNGGVINTILVYEWEGGANGSLNPDPVAGGAGAGVDCSTAAGGDTVCGEVNTATVTTPWLTSNKQDGTGHSLRISEFFEAGLNLTDSNLGGRCFNTFIATTRSSTSLTATIFDFSRGVLGQCTSTTTTTPKMADGTTNITSEPIPATGQLVVKDSAAIVVNGADTFDATVTFYLCTEEELVDSNGDPDPDGTCASGGTQIGTAKAVTSSSTIVSDGAGLTSAERYCWRAEFSGDADLGVPPSSDSSSGECFEVTPITPTLTTLASADITLGDLINDTISLTGTADTPGTNGISADGTIDATDRSPAGGTITFTAYGPDDCTTVAHSGTIAVSGDNTAYGGAGSATEFEPLAPGDYTYVASYDGDSPNTNGVADTACPDPSGDEEVTVTGNAALTTDQDWLPNDTATITGPTNLSGTVTFTLYTGNDCNDGDDDTLVYTSGAIAVSGPSPQTAETANTTVVVEAGSGDYSWLVVYDDAVLGDPAPTCERTTITITD